MTRINIDLVRAEALFVSDLQPSEHPDAQPVRSAIERTIARFGARYCALYVAGEYGDHPEMAAKRMSWAIQTVRSLHCERGPIGAEASRTDEAQRLSLR